MKLFTLKKHLSGIFFLYCCIISAQNQPQVEPRFKTFKDGLAFTAITVDQNKNVWAGTDKLGLFFLNQTTPTNTTFNLLSIGTAPVVSTLRIQSMAADKLGNVWIGHGGSNFSSGGGGVERVDITSNNVQHYSPDRNAKGLTFFERDGLATLNAQQVVVDDNNTVWVAHRYHDLTVVGIDPVFDPSQYILTPGAFSFKKSGADKFTSIGTWKDRSALPKLLPYPAFTYNPTPSQTPNSRVFNAISVDKTQMWTSVYGYEADSGVPNVRGPYLTARLLQSDLNGKLLFDFTKTKAKFASVAGVFNGVYANNLKGIWATSSLVNEGFSVYKNGKWINMSDSRLIPPGTRFNRAAIWGDSTGRVYMGTNNGLIVYDGYGAVGNIKSYRLYTKVAYTSPYSVLDTDMLSNNIIAGATEGKNSPNFSWIATDAGVMRCFISSDVIVYHVYEKKKPNEDNEINYEKLVELKSKSPTYTPPDSDKPHFAVDGTTSSIIRYKTSDFDGFYAPNSNYKYEITRNGIPVQVTDTLRYGKLTLKDKNIPNYKDKLLEDGSKYVDFIFRHPTYIDANDFVSDKNYTEKYELFISTKNDLGVSKILFYHPIRFSLPPVLLGHGVWSDVTSLNKIENYLKTKAGYTDDEIIKAWKTSKYAEVPFPAVSHIIPYKIKELISKSIDSKVSAGKVNVVVHSRGGLYTRAYIEGIDNSPTYNNDINSLITLDTPHKGSQFGNVILDNRIALDIKRPTLSNIDDLSILTNLASIAFEPGAPIKVGDIIKRVNPDAAEAGSWGAKNLTVEIDNLSDANKEPRFIIKLNEAQNRAKLKNIPIHAIAGTLDLCQITPVFCNGTSDFTSGLATFRLNPWLKALFLLNKGLDKGVKGLNDFLKEKVFNGETNDMIVPNSSMTADLESQYVSPLTGLNICHIDTQDILNSSGVTANPIVHERIFDLLKQNFKSPTSNFTLDGIKNYKPLSYNNFFPELKKVTSKQSKLKINEDKKLVIDPNSFTANMTSGSDVTFNIYQENIDDILISYDYPDMEDGFLQEKTTGLQFKNTFTFKVPEEFFGKFSVTAYGYSNGQLVVQHTVEPTVQLPASITLQSIKFKESENTILEKSNYPFQLLGTYSDGIERVINDLPGIAYAIEDNTILQQLDSKTFKSLIPGESTVIATIGALTTTLNLLVDKNPILLQSLITNYYTISESNGPITLKWDTFQEYQSKKFILERSTDNINFTPINEQLGQGIIYEPKNYTYTDDTTENLVYYRLRLLNLDDFEVFNQTIVVNRSTLSNENLDLAINKNELSLAPNPLNSNVGELFTNSSFSDNDAKLSIYDLTGKLISNNSYNIKEGNQKIQFEMPNGASNGIYLIQLKTKSYTKTIKLLLQK
jgi:hypothetical protein